ncbi:MAG: DUF2069 domain-containing protein [Candidatus Methylophosphatis roskildensis]|uniref:DUF2069 domain-containing protein n=1 Tax=Candidatus Methylophosphatis roskildensis TaxID=2899263 RepID=A0A9D7E5X3_9PROT|nr:DUF2069 domain-containing protein [Candidatus Methylophosphatis roskildensis]MBK7237062.1 DUF2069 domain-containing protein [Sterolibacteriaceae bacterium]MBK7665622.1 DUF2069 domain-containing protein [Sterolibacteriaceae bacterium]MBK9085864.1 DUF2069 domain-containing protein [Sterolibacteriaceae bacterium]
MNPRRLVAAASVTLIALIFLCVAWELWLAPLRAGGSMLVLKVLPLLAALFGTLRGRRYTYQWSSLLSLLYIAEGVVRGTSDAAPSATLAWGEAVLASIWFGLCLAFARATRPSLAADRAQY